MNENMKTVFVLDHTPYFGISGDDPFFLDLKTGKVSVKKSLWTSSVESSIEYCRIIWDLFPAGKLIRFVISDKAAHIVSRNFLFNSKKINLHFLFRLTLGQPPRKTSITSSTLWRWSDRHGLLSKHPTTL